MRVPETRRRPSSAGLPTTARNGRQPEQLPGASRGRRGANRPATAVPTVSHPTARLRSVSDPATRVGELPEPESPPVRVLHAAVPGRVRLGVPALKRRPEASRRLEELAGRWSGVRRASASPVTGNLLVEFDTSSITVSQLTAEVLAAHKQLPSLIETPPVVDTEPEPDLLPRQRSVRKAGRTTAGSAQDQGHKPHGATEWVTDLLEAGPVPPPPPARTRRLEIVLGAAAVAGAGALLVAVATHGHNLAIDRVPLDLAAQFHSPVLTAVMRGASRLSEPLVVTPMVVAATLGGVGRRAPGDLPWLPGAAVYGGGTLIMLLKMLLRRVRPSTFQHLARVRGYSLPSGHAFMAMCLYGMLAHHGLRWLRARRPDDRHAAAFLLASAAVAVLLVGISRVYLGVHYPTDVLAGYVLALLWLWLLAGIRRSRPPVATWEGGDRRVVSTA